MGTKTTPGKFDCFANAEPNEPMFVLLGRDMHAPALVEQWAHIREIQIQMGMKPESDRAKIKDARECAIEMRRFLLGCSWRADY